MDNMKTSQNLKSLNAISNDGEWFWDIPIYAPEFTFPIYQDQYQNMIEYMIDKYGENHYERVRTKN